MSCDLLTLLWIHSLPGLALNLKREIIKSGVINYWPITLKNELITWLENPAEYRFYSSLVATAELITQGYIHFLRFGHQDYPALLQQSPSPPAALFAQGDLDLLHTNGLAVVGSRDHTAHADAICKRWVPEFCAAGLTIISGMARGVDALAHSQALASCGATIAVMAGGVDVCYPRQNAQLFAQITSEGVVVSEQFPGVRPRPQDFPRRNRIICGLAVATLVVEGRIKSGSLITAREAVNASRPVFAVPGSPLNASAQGCLQLIKDGAQVAVDMKAVLSVFDTDYSPPRVAEIDSKISRAVASGGMTTEELADYFGLSIPAMIQKLSVLEFEGYLKCDHGFWYQSLFVEVN